MECLFFCSQAISSLTGQNCPVSTCARSGSGTSPFAAISCVSRWRAAGTNGGILWGNWFKIPLWSHTCTLPSPLDTTSPNTPLSLLRSNASEVEKWNIFSQADNFRVQKRPKMREASSEERKEAGNKTGGELNLTLIFYEYDPSSCNDVCNLACLLF